MPRGQCTLPADDAGRILDRLAGLEQVIRPDDIRQSLTATGRVSTRELRVDLRDHPLGGPRDGVVDRSADPAGLQARPTAPRGRGVAGPLQPLHGPAAAGGGAGAASVQPGRPTLARPETPGAFYRGLRLMGIDGVVLDVPDSPANAAAFGRPPPGRAATAPSPRSKAQPGRVGDPCRGRLRREALRRQRAGDGRRVAPPPDPGDAPASGPGFLQLRTVAGSDRDGR